MDIGNSKNYLSIKPLMLAAVKYCGLQKFWGILADPFLALLLFNVIILLQLH